jgi:hypothetical protein
MVSGFPEQTLESVTTTFTSQSVWRFQKVVSSPGHPKDDISNATVMAETVNVHADAAFCLGAAEGRGAPFSSISLGRALHLR